MTKAETAPGTEPYSGVLLRAVLWLAFLAPFFYATYGFANWLAAQHEGVGSIVFSWERHIPFLAWTIVPYWSINLFYALSLALNDTKRGVDQMAFRYLTAQVTAVSCFILFPLTATFVRPETSGLPGFMFAVLGGFDKPFNQAPSLHIALLVIIWDHWRHRLGGAWRGIWHLWCLLIGISVLTTWQHHFIDIPTGALVGLLALWLFPRTGLNPLAGAKISSDPRSIRLAAYYGSGAALALGGAVAGSFASPLWFLLLWPALALAIVAAGYAGLGARVFQKDEEGHVSLASRFLLLPYRTGARINAWAWTRRLPASVAIADGVFLGRFPTASEADSFVTVVDLAAEFERPSGSTGRWISRPMLDLVEPPHADVAAAAEAVERSRGSGPVLVCCALGFQRSAMVVAEWLVSTGRAETHGSASAMLAASGRPVYLRSTAAGTEAQRA